jgi:hypothetical protein
MSATRWVRVLAPFVAAAVTVALVAVTAGAHHTDATDPNDTRGKLDVRAVRMGHRFSTPNWTVVTFGKWSTASIWDKGYIFVMLDTQGKKAPEHYLLVRSVGTSLLGSLWRLRTVGPDSYLGTVPVSRPNLRSVYVQVRLGRLSFDEGRRFYRWWVETLFTSDVCRRVCIDRAPKVPVLQWRSGMSPTPTPSPSPSPSPSSSP